jgi:sirohydrochlorin ferrochelatase
MSRREEVDQALSVIDWKYDDYEGNWYAVLPLARTLADEIDALRTENERLDRKRLENALAARRYLGKLHEATATLDRLREVVFPDGAVLTADQVCGKYFAAQSILYPKENT